MNRRHLLSVLLPAIGGAIVLAVWFAVKGAGVYRDYVVPWPGQVLEAAWDERASLLAGARQTGFAALVGFLSAATAGIFLSLALSSASWLRQMWFPWVMVMQMTPVIVLAPIIILLYGQGLPSITIITFIITFFPVVANTTAGLISTDRNLIALFTVLNATRFQEVWLLRFPFALPYLFTGLRISATLAPIGALVGDFFAGQLMEGEGGLGYLVVMYNANLKTDALFATAGTACILGFLFVAVVNSIQWLCLRNWHESAGQRMQ